jgi:hypothetical protein
MKERQLEGVSDLELIDAEWLPGRIVPRERSRKTGVAAGTFQAAVTNTRPGGRARSRLRMMSSTSWLSNVKKRIAR